MIVHTYKDGGIITLPDTMREYEIVTAGMTKAVREIRAQIRNAKRRHVKKLDPSDFRDLGLEEANDEMRRRGVTDDEIGDFMNAVASHPATQYWMQELDKVL